jgi:type I pantothenate kinase
VSEAYVASHHGRQKKLMSKKEQTLMTPYLQFNRSQWAALRDSVPMTLTEGEIARLKGINEDLSLEEVAEIYLPLSRLLNFYISSNLRRQAVLEQFLGTNGQRIPYIISIAGSVAVGKSTTARVLQALLSRWPEHRRVELITTDGFLHPNQVLKDRGLMKKKGFPQSYDMHRLVKFVSDIKSGVPNVTAPVYSHLIYDVIPDGDKTVTQPDILILKDSMYYKAVWIILMTLIMYLFLTLSTSLFMSMRRKSYYRNGISIAS